ncbi:hypothetical protein WS84_27940 [Burkholderia anthina]|uniref:hypothetical protein n=1 Tax=Burkholderia anthina TaxID=179879 RepID=UPI000752322F|nr:hypothetical protein [Burkholderia anthina]KVH05368.1 hypothetical protein WS84_27940 [Burkholderia anthina]
MKIHHEVDPTPLRQADYQDVGEQLDAIMKGFDALARQGIQLPGETLEWIRHCNEVKDRYKKE